MISLDEAIKHAKEVAERNRREASFEPEDDVDKDIKINCSACAEEHEQLAGWLEELRELREMVKCNAFTDGYNKAINDCAEVISELPVMCERSCPIECDYATDKECKENWKIYLTEHVKITKEEKI